MSGAYGTICGAQYVDAKGTALRCYARGQSRYGGRCWHHEGAGEECSKPRQGPRCGWTRTENGLACANPVFRSGQRCSLHAPERLQASQARRRADLLEKLRAEARAATHYRAPHRHRFASNSRRSVRGPIERRGHGQAARACRAGATRRASRANSTRSTDCPIASLSPSSTNSRVAIGEVCCDTGSRARGQVPIKANCRRGGAMVQGLRPSASGPLLSSGSLRRWRVRGLRQAAEGTRLAYIRWLCPRRRDRLSW